MTDAILVINAGSSSLKFAGYAANEGREPVLLAAGKAEAIRTAPRFVVKDKDGATVTEDHWRDGTELSHSDCLAHLLDWMATNAADVRIQAVGHRIAHGGADFRQAVRIDDDVMRRLEALIPLAPLHQPHNLAPVQALADRLGDVPQVACFDTSFHADKPEVAAMFALPREMTERGVRRYGFHGLSYEYISRELPRYAPEASKVVVAHLGSGASMCAIRDGRSIDSTMGFTAVDGLPMGTRTGALDPGVVLYCLHELGMDAAAIEDLLYRRSGLLGVSGISNDMRRLLDSDDPHAAQAVDLFVYHVARNVGALAVAMGGLDALVFTAGIGENAAPVRAAVAEWVAWLGLAFDADANAAGGPRISTDGSRVSAWVIPTDEERMIARHTARVLGLDGGAR